jgi:hypothetical protein
MPDAYQHELVTLMSRLARLLSPRSSTPRPDGYKSAHTELRSFAARHGHTEEWCDGVLNLILEGRAGDGLRHSARAA